MCTTALSFHVNFLEYVYSHSDAAGILAIQIMLKKPVKLRVDAWKKPMIINQDDKPMAHASRSLTKPNRTVY